MKKHIGNSIRRLSELAFDSDRKRMSTLHDIDGVPTMFTKGAIDSLLNRSTHVLTSRGCVALTPQLREQIVRVNTQMSEQGLRVLAFAYRELDTDRQLELEDECSFTFPRSDFHDRSAALRKRFRRWRTKRGGIKTVMITGDHKITATAIARQLGIFADGDIPYRRRAGAVTDAELDRQLPHISVYARVSPEHKIRIVHGMAAARQHRFHDR